MIFHFLRVCNVKITSIHLYDTFENYLKNETLEKCLPGIDTLENGKISITNIILKRTRKNIK